MCQLKSDFVACFLRRFCFVFLSPSSRQRDRISDWNWPATVAVWKADVWNGAASALFREPVTQLLDGLFNERFGSSFATTAIFFAQLRPLPLIPVPSLVPPLSHRKFPSTLNISRSQSIFMGFTRFYWVLLGFTGFYWVLLGFTGFYWVLTGLYGV